MADLTRQAEVTGEWVEVSAAGRLNMAAGTTYRLEIATGPGRGALWLAETDAAEAPTVRGAPWFPPTRRRGADRLTYQLPSGARLWARSPHGDATIAATPT